MDTACGGQAWHALLVCSLQLCNPIPQGQALSTPEPGCASCIAAPVSSHAHARRHADAQWGRSQWKAESRLGLPQSAMGTAGSWKHSAGPCSMEGGNRESGQPALAGAGHSGVSTMGGWEVGDKTTLPRVCTQCTLQEGQGAPRQPSIAATQQDEPFAQASLHVSSALAAHRVLGTQPTQVRHRGLGSHRDLRSPSWTPYLPQRAWMTHMMNTVTPIAQMSVCGLAPWPSRSSGAREGVVHKVRG